MDHESFLRQICSKFPRHATVEARKASVSQKDLKKDTKWLGTIHL